jgi:K+-sensing histidine kinase KdpD
LSICYGIVQEHGGEIHAMNLEPSGARVVLELPIHTDARIPSPAAAVH